MKRVYSLLTCVVLLTITGITYAKEEIIRIKGSDTLFIVAQTWAEAYDNIRPEVTISLGGGGSGCREPGSPPPVILLPGPGSLVPCLLPRLPGGQLRPSRRGDEQSPVEVGQGSQAGAGPDAGTDGRQCA